MLDHSQKKDESDDNDSEKKFNADDTAGDHRKKYHTLTDAEIISQAFVFFAAPLLQKAYLLTVLDVGFMFVGFLAVMLAEGLALSVLLRLERKWQWRPATSFLLFTGLMALNIFHFFFVVMYFVSKLKQVRAFALVQERRR